MTLEVSLSIILLFSQSHVISKRLPYVHVDLYDNADRTLSAVLFLFSPKVKINNSKEMIQPEPKNSGLEP